MASWKSVLKRLLSIGFRWSLQKKILTLRVGNFSNIFFWRIRSVPGTRFLVGESSRVETRLTLEKANAFCSVGNRSFIGEGQISCAARVEIGDDVMIAWGTAIFDHSSHSLKFSERAGDVTAWLTGEKNWQVVAQKPVKICNKAWIGYGSIILSGVEIGEGAIVGAGSVVTRDVPEWTIVAGNPAKVIRLIAEDER
jgi:acetyltransferase-like isoleucine patch superfamily enzyme